VLREQIFLFRAQVIRVIHWYAVCSLKRLEGVPSRVAIRRTAKSSQTAGSYYHVLPPDSVCAIAAHVIALPPLYSPSHFELLATSLYQQHQPHAVPLPDDLRSYTHTTAIQLTFFRSLPDTAAQTTCLNSSSGSFRLPLFRTLS